MKMSIWEILFLASMTVAVALLLWQLFGSPGWETLLVPLYAGVYWLYQNGSNFKSEMRVAVAELKAEMKAMRGPVDGLAADMKQVKRRLKIY